MKEGVLHVACNTHSLNHRCSMISKQMGRDMAKTAHLLLYSFMTIRILHTV